MWAFEEYLAEKDRPKYRARERYWHPAVIRNGDFIETTAKQYGPDIFSDYVVDFIKRKRDSPFLAYYPMVLTHGPHAPSPDTVKSEEDKFKTGRQNYKACVEYMDKIVGKLVRALEENGLRDNTIIFFTADNGTAGEGKGDATELGARVPMIINGAGIQARGATGELTDLSDVLPTLAAFAGAKLPKGKPIDGRSLAGFLKGESPAPREWAYSYIADRRILRTRRYLLEDNSPLHWGTLFDCGTSRDGTGYRDVTKSSDPEVIAVKEQFDRILSDMPVPFIPEEGHPAELKTARRRKQA
jgi:arylsulfatase A-like enzyme